MSNIPEGIFWFGHASFQFENKEGNKFFFIDPFDLRKLPNEKADAIFITHAHYDHWSPADIRKLLSDETVVVAVNGCENLELSGNRFMIVEPGRAMNIAGMKVSTVPAYNIKQERLTYHPKSNRWVGYVFEMNGERIYHAGDTDLIPEMSQLEDIDVAMVPIGGTYTMDVNEAIEAANKIGADVTIPMHYKRLLGEKSSDAEQKFVSGVKGKVVVMRELS